VYKRFQSRNLKKGVSISSLINNAGIQNIGQTQTTKDGFERTFAVNHLGPLYLTLLLLPLMETNANITFTASDTHDPLQKTGIENPAYTSGKDLAYPKETDEKKSMVGQRRYSTSKLCNVMTAYELQRHLANGGIRVNAFDPGMVPGTGLAKNYPPLLKFIWNNVMPILTYFKRNTNTAKKSGSRLANLTHAQVYKNIKGKYFSDGKVINSSADSYNQSYQQDLWRTSIELLGIKQNETSVSLV
jgi:NAD(P)-dependent dehydrogenase (short-subunit alcohol dehydrogenase family)